MASHTALLPAAPNYRRPRAVLGATAIGPPGRRWPPSDTQRLTRRRRFGVSAERLSVSNRCSAAVGRKEVQVLLGPIRKSITHVRTAPCGAIAAPK